MTILKNTEEYNNIKTIVVRRKQWKCFKLFFSTDKVKDSQSSNFNDLIVREHPLHRKALRQRVKKLYIKLHK